MLLQLLSPPDSQGLLVLVAAHGSPHWHRRQCLHTDACVCLCMPLYMFGLQWPPGPFSITLFGSHGVESVHQRQISGSWGGGISPHPSSRQRGRGEGGVNLPTALLIAHMPGHQEPAVTVETISTPPSPSLYGVGLRQGIKHPPTHLSLLPFSLSPSPSFVSPPLICPPLYLTSLSSSPTPISLLPFFLSLHFPGIPCSTPIPAQLFVLAPPHLSSLHSPIIPFTPVLFFSPFSGPPLYECVFPSVVSKEEGWAFFRALRTKFKGPRQVGSKPRADTQESSVYRIGG